MNPDDVRVDNPDARAAIPAHPDRPDPARRPDGPWMSPWRDGHLVEAERRDARRLVMPHADDLRCSLGRVVDLSTRGLRIARRTGLAPGAEIFTFTLRSGPDRLVLRGGCVWSRRTGFMRHLVGIALAGMTAEETRLLRAFIDRHAPEPVVALAG